MVDPSEMTGAFEREEPAVVAGPGRVRLSADRNPVSYSLGCSDEKAALVIHQHRRSGSDRSV
ncbi:hypothetical protein [Methylobacterium fujisawaense]|uniref:hypothetical protein n=1 Tax=Methylobacterium fujisawaense TaxID=107400 RepID=UPI00313BAD63